MLKRGRGRPPHPDILTPREWEVLELVEQGLTNEQIAAQLGISTDGAKYHVAQILAKLGVSSRREAGQVARANRGRPQRRWALLPFLGKLGAGKTANAVAAGGIVSAGLIALVILFFDPRSRASEPFDMYPGLYVLDIASGKVERKVDFPSSGVEYEWTADSKSFLITKDTTLQLIDVDTGAVKKEASFAGIDLVVKRLPTGQFALTYLSRAPRPVYNDDSQAGGIGILDPASLTLTSERQLPYIRSNEVEWRPDGEQALFVSNPDLVAPSDQVYFLHDLLGSAPTGPVLPRSWSPDGTSYVQTTVGPDKVLEVRDSATDALLRTLDLTPTQPSALAWSPDSRWLIALGDQQLLIQSVDGRTPPRVLADGQFAPGQNRLFDDTVSVSPDSGSIAFANKDGELWKVDIATGETTRLLKAPLPAVVNARWSPDGTRIAFVVSAQGSIHVVNRDGTDDQYVVSGSGADLSPDGRRIVFGFVPNTYVIKTDGRGLVPLTDNERDFIGYTDRMTPCMAGGRRDTRWTPDGKSVTMSFPNFEVFRVSVLNPAQREAVEIEAEAGSLSWSEDGSRYAYSVNSGKMFGECTIVMRAADGAELARVPGTTFEWFRNSLLATKFSDHVLLGPDGRQVAHFTGQVALSPGLDLVLVFGEEAEGTDLVEVSSGRAIQHFETFRPQGGFSATGKYFTIKSSQTTLDVYETSSLNLLHTLTDGSSVLFSPDETTIAYSTFARVSPLQDARCCEASLYLLDLDDPSAKPVKLVTGIQVNTGIWSPESTHLAFSAGDAADKPNPDGFVSNGPLRLIIVDRRSLKQVEVAPSGSWVRWFPDGKRIVYETQ